MHVAALLALASFASATPTGDPTALEPSHETAKQNAHHIFNALHSATRQWGSSLYHNGMGFIPAIVPKGTLLHHGSPNKTIPKHPEWLAFEVEHAEMFAFGMRPRDPDDDDDDDDHPGAEGAFNVDSLPRYEQLSGFFHTYQARRDLNLLYFDGSAAAKTNMGTLDAQDLVVRKNGSNNEGWNEMSRAIELCEQATSWGYDGVIRMECGFEIIHCNFTDSLDLVSQTRTVANNDRMSQHELALFDISRAVSQRYDGIGAGRIRLDLSSMVSGFFYPINISSQTPGRPDLVRFASAKPEELSALRDTIGKVASQPRKFTVDWQAVVDQVVTRFADRFTMLAADEGLTDLMFRDELEGLVLTYYDAPPNPAVEDSITLEQYYGRREKEALERCLKHFLLPALVFKEQFSSWDDLIYTAVTEVTHTICKTTQQVWIQLNQTTSASGLYDDEEQTAPSHELRRREDIKTLRDAVQEARSAIRDLMDELAWTIWKKKRPCPPNAFVYVAMWPFGSPKDHWDPGCRSTYDLSSGGRGRGGYWDNGRLKPS